MAYSSIYIEYYISEFEKSYILLIERELNVFFSKCLKFAEAYSIMVANKPSLHSKKIFEELVLSPEAIESFVQNVILKINNELKKDTGLSYKCTNLFNMNSNYSTFIDNTIETIRTSQIVTKVCEKIIDSVISYMFDEICPVSIMNKLFKRVISGKKILHSSNFENQVEKHKRLIYKQIKGFLINIKINLRNELIKEIIVFINNTINMKNSTSIA